MPRVLLLAAAVLALVLLPAASTAAGLDWPQMGGDSGHSGYLPSLAAFDRCGVGSLTQRWSAPYGRSAQSAPAIVGNRVYIGTESGLLVALDLATGAKVWETAVGSRVSAPTVDNGRIFVTSGDGLVRAYRQSDGGLIWTAAANANGFQTPVAGAGVVVVGTFTVHAYDPATGFQRWNLGNETGIAYEAAIVGDTIVIANNGVLLGLTPDGSTLWSSAPPQWGGGGVRLRVSARDQLAYAGGFNGHIGAFNLGDGALRWFAYPQGEVFAPAIAPDGIYVHSSNNRMYAYDPFGNQRWMHDTSDGIFPGGVSSSFPPVYVGGVLFLSTALIGADGRSAENSVLAMDARSGSILWKGKLGRERGTQPAVAGNLLLVHTENRLVAFGQPTTLAAPLNIGGRFQVLFPIVYRGPCA